MAAAPSTNIPSSGLPPLFALPPALLVGSILDHLTPAEVARTLTTTKHPRVAPLWTRALAQCLGRFTPARAWFAVQDKNARDDGRACMREAYAPDAEAAEGRLAALLKEAGVVGAK
jgi:hypothetical protein